MGFPFTPIIDNYLLQTEGTSAKEGTGIEEAFSWLVNSAATFVSKKKEAQKQILISSVSQTVTHHHGV